MEFILDGQGLRRRFICVALLYCCSGSVQNSKASDPPRQDKGHVTATQPFVGPPSPPPSAISLPPPPPGVTDLSFKEFFKFPVGDRGLELTDKLRGLDKKRVRIVGYMARKDIVEPGQFIMASVPVKIDDDEMSLCDDLPGATVFVIDPARPHVKPAFIPGRLVLTGTLSLGNREEPDGRISLIRLTLDMPTSAPSTQDSSPPSNEIQPTAASGVVKQVPAAPGGQVQSRSSGRIEKEKD
ncbi:MAG TPA: hypothetical protein VMV81_03245 [Phycisphaerae bacterium]|nr:hypothetical protein [Phycisphaerae bacterium]